MLNETDLSRCDLNLLVLFEKVFEERHVGRAARKLHISPSAVSHGLGRLRQLFNDPLFLRTPKGVVPTARARELAPSILEILTRIRGVVASSGAFDPRSSSRRFVIGAPDGVTEVLLPSLLAQLQREARGIDIGIRELLPTAAARSPQQIWEPAFADLDRHAADIMLLPVSTVPSRFATRHLYDEDFIVAVCDRHPFSRNRTLRQYCDMPHLVVSLTGDPFGFVDEALAERGLSRRIALTTPNFMSALASVAETDLLATLPRHLALRHAHRFNVKCIEAPLALPRFQINCVLPKVALSEPGVCWLLDRLLEAASSNPRAPGRRETSQPHRR